MLTWGELHTGLYSGQLWGEGSWIFLWGIHRPGDLSLASSTEAPDDLCTAGHGAKRIRGLFSSDNCLAASQCLKSAHLWEELGFSEMCMFLSIDSSGALSIH